MNKVISRRSPELENDFIRRGSIEYDLKDAFGFLRCIEHGAPHPLIRWHQHEEYELHLITSTSGKMFVGDYIGEFGPGSLVLTGPYLPHNWISEGLPEGGVPSRDISLQFSGETFGKVCDLMPELQQVLPLLDRSKNGIEFFGISDFAKEQMIKIKNKNGVNSLKEFLVLISSLSNHNEYKLLSYAQVQRSVKETKTKFSDVFEYIVANYNSQLVMSEIAERKGMDSSKFSRCFKNISGMTFTEYVNRLRINHACQLLNDTDMFISTICYQVGFNTVANFNRRFGEIKKITPREYRKQGYSKYDR